MSRWLVYRHKSSDRKMKARFKKKNSDYRLNTAHTIVELCAIRNGVANCDVMSSTEANELTDLISLQ